MSTVTRGSGATTQIENGSWVAVWDGETVVDAEGNFKEFATQQEALADMERKSGITATSAAGTRAMSSASASVDWAETNLCLKLHCTVCSGRAIVTGKGAEYIRCPSCRTVFRMPDRITVNRVENEPESGILSAATDSDEE